MHPFGIDKRVGGCPPIAEIGALTSMFMVQIELTKAFEYGCKGSLITSPIAPSSMIFPPYITANRSQKLDATPRSCVINMTAMLRSSTIRFKRSITLAWVVTSKAVVGSSAIKSLGLVDIAIATITLCRIPPEN